MDYKFKEGEVVEFNEHIVADPQSALWAQVSIFSPKTGHIQLSSAKDEVQVDGHLEYVKFDFPELEPGNYSYVVIVANAAEELAKFEGAVTVERAKKESTPKKKTPAPKKKVVVKEDTPQSPFTSETFLGNDE